MILILFYIISNNKKEIIRIKSDQLNLDLTTTTTNQPTKLYPTMCTKLPLMRVPGEKSIIRSLTLFYKKLFP